MNALVISNSTAVRAMVIAQRTGSEFMAGAKSIMINELKRRMQNEVVQFVFLKKNGELRTAWGTTNPTLIRKHTNGRGVSREKYLTTCYWDLECAHFRSFRWESLVKVF